jgi:hypothetical protein
MLAPDQRALYLEVLRPPEGYRFDRGIGTTFSLDLFTLLVAPVSLSLLDVEDVEQATQDPVLMLEGIRRYADRLSIFCQAGRIAVPQLKSPLLSLLEQTVVEVQVPFGGVFHPKVWLLRYEPESEHGDENPLYRLLNLSRNLTFDKSWDLMLRLEGHLATHRTYAYARNHPLGNFIECLPDMAVRPPAQRILDDIALLQDEVRRVDFQIPEPFSDHLGFYPAGIQGYRAYRFKDRCDRALIISPFLSDRMLRRITKEGAGHVLISRPESLGALKPETKANFEDLYTFEEMGVEQEEPDPAEDVGQPVVGARPNPLGLHAKLFVIEAGWDATWLIGSANATNAAFFRHNVEFMVELKGKKSRIGIDEILDKEAEHGLFSMLRGYSSDEIDEELEGDQEAEQLANRVRRWLLDLKLRLQVEAKGEETFNLSLHPTDTQHSAPAGTFTISCWPTSLPSEHSHPLLKSASSTQNVGTDTRNQPLETPVIWEVSRLALTTFIAFEIDADVAGRQHKLRFTLNLPITGLPQDREDYVFSAILSNQKQFLRYLRLLLADREELPAIWAATLTNGMDDRAQVGGRRAEIPLLKDLMRALSRDSAKIDQIAQVVERLQRTAEGRAVLPEDFQVLWDAVEQARGEIE